MEEKVKKLYENVCTDLKAEENASITAKIVKELLINKSQIISVEDALTILDDAKKIIPRLVTF